jgi:L-ribulose-5-phosphate 4-epimerase
VKIRVRDLKKEICDTSLKLYRQGHLTDFGGNISARLPNSNEVWITPSASTSVLKDCITPESLVKVDLNGKVLEGKLKPSIETGFHVGIMKKRPDVNSVIHTHSPLSVALGATGQELKPVCIETLMLGEVPLVPWCEGGTEELHNAVVEKVGKETKALLLKHHGVISLGSSLREALIWLYCLERAVYVMIAAKQLGTADLVPLKKPAQP